MDNNNHLTPREIVKRLDEYIIGQDDAKRAVSIALRNRYRRLQLPEEMQKEITPKNILMIGPTGVGKTEIARRLADIVNAPFIKVEATKFTEVGYIGRDVESMVRDLVEKSIAMVRDNSEKDIRPEAYRKAVDYIAAVIVPADKKEVKNPYKDMPFMEAFDSMGIDSEKIMPKVEEEKITPEIEDKRREVVQEIKVGKRDTEEVTVMISDKSQTKPMGMMPGLEGMGLDLGSALSSLQQTKKVEKRMSVADALEELTDDFAAELVKTENIQGDAIKLAESSGVIFIDEIDKITSKGSANSGEVSREGVQRDILPIVEGSSVQTKYGTINTDHILFIGSGAFSMARPSDLIPELQGRFPIRVELDDLTADDFYRILTEPNNALIHQYQALLGTEGIEVVFTKEAIERISKIAYQVNTETENIGARRLHTIIEKVLEDLLFESAEMNLGEVKVTEAYVDEKVGDIAQNEDLSRYIL